MPVTPDEPLPNGHLAYLTVRNIPHLTLTPITTTLTIYIAADEVPFTADYLQVTTD